MERVTEQRLYEVAVSSIVPGRWQPRETFGAEKLLELAKSVKDVGLMYPIIVFVNEDGEHELVAGERRVRAMTALGLVQCKSWTGEHGNGLRKAIEYTAGKGWVKLEDDVKLYLLGVTVTARIEDGSDHRRLHELAVADNIQRENLSPVEEARALQDLMDEYDLSQRDVAKLVGWSQSKAQERLALLKLAPEVRKAVTARAVSTSHARHLAKLPVEVQPAVTAHVAALIKREGDQEMTVSKIAVLTRQLKSFINPVHWHPPADVIITPKTRNNLRLVRQVLQGTNVGERVEEILALRSVGYSKENLTGKKPVGLGDGALETIIAALTGKKRGLGKTWLEYAGRFGWTCKNCQMLGCVPPVSNAFGAPCMYDKCITGTCHNFIGVDDPLIIPLSRELVRWMNSFAPDDLIRDPFCHVVNYALWMHIVEQTAQREAEQQRQAEEKRENKHIVALAEYWRQQRAGGFFTAVNHFQAHLCWRCTHYREELLEQELPPCDFVMEPLTGRWKDDPRSPNFGILVRQDGQMLPRCEHFHLAILDIAPSAGFVLPDRGIVAEWMRRILVGHNQCSHDYTMEHPLAWLPYPRAKRDEVHNTDRLLSYIKRMWKEVGDECVATLITCLASEDKACNNSHNPFELFDPTTLVAERWASVSWKEAVLGEDMHYYGWSSWPDGWPKPWEKVDG